VGYLGALAISKCIFLLDPRQGFEPQFPEPKSGELPLFERGNPSYFRYSMQAAIRTITPVIANPKK
jgi:hypothetical protein